MDKRDSKWLNGPFNTFFLLVKPVQQAQLLAKLDFVTYVYKMDTRLN